MYSFHNWENPNKEIMATGHGSRCPPRTGPRRNRDGLGPACLVAPFGIIKLRAAGEGQGRGRGISQASRACRPGTALIPVMVRMWSPLVHER